MAFKLMRISMASLLFVFFSMPVNAELVLSSPAIDHGGNLPADLKCTRDGGDGLSPPISWTGAPAGTESFAVIMHHYPRGRVEGVDIPSHYWLVWKFPRTRRSFPEAMWNP